LQIENEWKDAVDDRTIDLLGAAIERRIRTGVPRGAFLPHETTRFEVVKHYNRFGKALFDFVEHTGLENSRSTRPRDLDKVDIFWYDCFLNLTTEEQLTVLSYADPMDEFVSIKDEKWINLLEYLDYRNNGAYQRALRICMTKLQKFAEEKKLVAERMEGVIETWEEIAEFMNRSVPTVMKMAMDKDNPLPVSMIGGTAVSTKALLTEYVQKCITRFPYHKMGRKGQRNLAVNCVN
jgi:hypothetical protein